MAAKDYSSPTPDKWVTIGGTNNKTGKPNPVQIEGYYLGSTQSPNTFKPGEMKTTYVLKTATGLVGVNGSSNLNRKMKESEVNLLKDGVSALGVKVYITFIGLKPSGKGQPTKLFTALFDADDKDASVSAGGLFQTEIESADDDYDEQETETFANNNSVDEDAEQIAALAAAENQVRIQTLLNKNRKVANK